MFQAHYVYLPAFTVPLFNISCQPFMYRSIYPQNVHQIAFSGGFFGPERPAPKYTRKEGRDWSTTLRATIVSQVWRYVATDLRSCTLVNERCSTTTFKGFVLLGCPKILSKWILTPRKRNLISLVKLLISHWIPNSSFSRQAHCSGVPPKTLKFFWKYPSETKSISWKSSRPLKHSHLELLI